MLQVCKYFVLLLVEIQSIAGTMHCLVCLEIVGRSHRAPCKSRSWALRSIVPFRLNGKMRIHSGRWH